MLFLCLLRWSYGFFTPPPTFWYRCLPLPHLDSDTLYQDTLLWGYFLLTLLELWTHILGHIPPTWRPTSLYLGFKTPCHAASLNGYLFTQPRLCQLVAGQTHARTSCSPCSSSDPMPRQHFCVDIPFSPLGFCQLLWATMLPRLALLVLSAADADACLALFQLIILAESFVKGKEDKRKEYLYF